MPIAEDPSIPLHHQENPRLTHPTLDTLHALKLMGRSHALLEQRQMPEMTEGPFEDRLGLLVDRESPAREDRRLQTRLHQAKLRQTACLEAIDSRHPRGLDKSRMRSVATCQWGRHRHHGLSTGPTGIGTTWLACALGHQAGREGWTVRSLRLPRLLQEFPRATGAGRSVKRMTAVATTEVLLLDDWGLAPLSEDNRRDFLERLDDRQDCRATIVTSQLPVEHWHAASGEPPLADAILDRLVHNADKMVLQGDSMRTRQAIVPPHAPSV